MDQRYTTDNTNLNTQNRREREGRQGLKDRIDNDLKPSNSVMESSLMRSIYRLDSSKSKKKRVRELAEGIHNDLGWLSIRNKNVGNLSYDNHLSQDEYSALLDEFANSANRQIDLAINSQNHDYRRDAEDRLREIATKVENKRKEFAAFLDAPPNYSDSSAPQYSGHSNDNNNNNNNNSDNSA